MSIFYSLKQAQHVLLTNESGCMIVSFNKENKRIAQFSYKTREGALSALQDMLGKVPKLKKMQVDGAEKVDTQQDISDIPAQEL